MTTNRTKKGDKKNLSLKRRLRSHMTPAENILWLKLKGKQLGFKFRRQHGIGPFIVDFFCPDKKLVIEVDGEIHAREERIEKDRLREDYLKRFELQVIRYRNEEVLSNIDGVLEDLMRRIEFLPPLAPPFKGGEPSGKPFGLSED